MRIIHIAPFNTAGVPMTFVKAERILGHESRLITMGKHPQGREEDICLNLPLLDSRVVRGVKRIVTPEHRRTVSHIARKPEEIPIRWEPGGWTERLLFLLREALWKSKIEEAIRSHDLLDYDVYQLDGGLEFYRDGRIIRRLKDRGKRIICCYLGSDLRTRGVIPVIDTVSDLNITVEFDLQAYHPNIRHVPFPLDVSGFTMSRVGDEDTLRIGHAPTKREAKGSDTIIPIVKQLEKAFSVRLVLIEGLPYDKAIALKQTCHVFIDQIGDLGYGMNSLEALAMGIPACTSLAPGFEEAYPDHPFVVINAENLKDRLIELIRNPGLRKNLREQGRAWIERVHDAQSVVKQIHRLAGFDV